MIYDVISSVKYNLQRVPGTPRDFAHGLSLPSLAAKSNLCIQGSAAGCPLPASQPTTMGRTARWKLTHSSRLDTQLRELG